MLTSVRAGAVTVRGVSVGGVYTSLHVRELDLMLDVGIAPRGFAGTRALLLSHGHADHCGALMSLLGTRMLTCGNRRLVVFLPAELVDPIRALVDIVDQLQRNATDVELIPMRPGDERPLHSDLFIRAFRTHHPVPSLGYIVVRRVHKLRRDLVGLDGATLRRRRQAGEPITYAVDRCELAYVTDTLPDVLDEVPDLCSVKTLILECTFLDDRKPAELAHRSYHIHLDDLLARADRLRNDAIVLVHFSQLYRPREVVDLIERRCPDGLRQRIAPLVPARRWPG